VANVNRDLRVHDFADLHNSTKSTNLWHLVTAQQL